MIYCKFFNKLCTVFLNIVSLLWCKVDLSIITVSILLSVLRGRWLVWRPPTWWLSEPASSPVLNVVSVFKPVSSNKIMKLLQTLQFTLEWPSIGKIIKLPLPTKSEHSLRYYQNIHLWVVCVAKVVCNKNNFWNQVRPTLAIQCNQLVSSWELDLNIQLKFYYAFRKLKYILTVDTWQPRPRQLFYQICDIIKMK